MNTRYQIHHNVCDHHCDGNNYDAAHYGADLPLDIVDFA